MRVVVGRFPGSAAAALVLSRIDVHPLLAGLRRRRQSVSLRDRHLVAAAGRAVLTRRRGRLARGSCFASHVFTSFSGIRSIHTIIGWRLYLCPDLELPLDGSARSGRPSKTPLPSWSLTGSLCGSSTGSMGGALMADTLERAVEATEIVDALKSFGI